MQHQRALWIVAGLIGLVVLAWLAPAFTSKPKARPQRITAVNCVRQVTFVLTSTNVVSGPATPSGR